MFNSWFHGLSYKGKHFHYVLPLILTEWGMFQWESVSANPFYALPLFYISYHLLDCKMFVIAECTLSPRLNAILCKVSIKEI